MRNLHPKMIAVVGTSLSPILQLSDAAIAVNCHIAGALQNPFVDLYVAGDEQAGPAIGPALVEPAQLWSGSQIAIRKSFGHGRLGQSVRQTCPAGEPQRLRQMVRHCSSVSAALIAHAFSFIRHILSRKGTTGN